MAGETAAGGALSTRRTSPRGGAVAGRADRRGDVIVGQVEMAEVFEGAKGRFEEEADLVFASGGASGHGFAAEEPLQVIRVRFDKGISTGFEGPSSFGGVDLPKVVDAKVARSTVAGFEETRNSDGGQQPNDGGQDGDFQESKPTPDGSRTVGCPGLVAVESHICRERCPYQFEAVANGTERTGSIHGRRTETMLRNLLGLSPGLFLLR